MKILLFVLGLISSLVSAHCQVLNLDPDTKRLCAQVKDVELPAQDRPSAEEKNALANCNSQDIYFGLGQPADPMKARKCAYLEMEQGGNDLDVRGRSILMMVYANGKGAERNLDVALKLACEMGGTPGDVAGSVHELVRYKNSHWTGDTFSVCSHSSGRHLYEQCAILSDRFDKIERTQKLDSMTSKWGTQEKMAFRNLREAADKYFKSRATSEIDLGPTFEVQEEAFLENGFIEKLEKLQNGELPKFSTHDATKADTALASELAAIEKDPNRKWGTAGVEGVKNTQPLWIAYRDAWVRFGKKGYPKVGATSWKTWITQERVAVLGNLLH